MLGGATCLSGFLFSLFFCICSRGIYSLKITLNNFSRTFLSDSEAHVNESSGQPVVAIGVVIGSKRALVNFLLFQKRKEKKENLTRMVKKSVIAERL